MARTANGAAATAGAGADGSGRRLARAVAAARAAAARASKQALELVRAKPGITIPELADSMGIKANYLYRVLPNLASDGKVKRRGKGWHPA